MKEVWKWVKEPGTKVSWADMVWHKHGIPKHALTTWRAMRGRLLTKTLMNKRGAKHDPTCVLCMSMEEDIEHLFWGCTFTREVWGQLLLHLQISPNIDTSLAREANRILHIRGKRLAAITRKWVFNAMIHECWQERNRRIFEGDRKKPGDIISAIKDTIRCMGEKVKDIVKNEEEHKTFIDTWK